MVLSFMILWDLTAIRAGVASLRTSRLAPVYEEIAPSFAIFGTLFGKALQAQVGLSQAFCSLTLDNTAVSLDAQDAVPSQSCRPCRLILKCCSHV